MTLSDPSIERSFQASYSRLEYPYNDPGCVSDYDNFTSLFNFNYTMKVCVCLIYVCMRVFLGAGLYARRAVGRSFFAAHVAVDRKNASVPQGCFETCQQRATIRLCGCSDSRKTPAAVPICDSSSPTVIACLAKVNYRLETDPTALCKCPPSCRLARFTKQLFVTTQKPSPPLPPPPSH